MVRRNGGACDTRRAMGDDCCGCCGRGDASERCTLGEVGGATTASGDGFFFRTSVGGGFIASGGGATFRPCSIPPLPPLRATPGPNRARVSATDERFTLDPNVGVPQRLLARSITPLSISVSRSAADAAPPKEPSAAADGTSKNADPLPARARRWAGTGTATGSATTYPKSEPGAQVTRTTFHPADAARVTISRRVRSCPLNVTCICTCRRSVEKRLGRDSAKP